MQIKFIKSSLIFVMAGLMSMLSANARIGETTNETARRYGKPTFVHNNSNGVYSRYHFKGKDIEVVFVNGKAIFESFYFARETLYSNEQGARLGKQSTNFVLSLLTNAYGFTQQQAAEVVRKRGRLLGYGRIAAKFTLDMQSISQHVFAANLIVQQNNMDNIMMKKCNIVLSKGAYAIRAKERNKQSRGF